jgi:hypothetical protein
MTELAALNVKINGDSADLQSDIAKAKAQLQGFDTQVNKAQAGTTRFSGGLSRLSGVSRQTRAQITNTSYQLQDIAVQLQAGTRASTVFAQQLPQLFSGFGTLGAVVGVLAGVGIPALAFAFSNMRSEVVDTDEALDNLQTAFDELIEAQKLASASAQELAEKFGTINESVIAIVDAQRRLQERNLNEQFVGLVGALRGLSPELDNAVAATNRLDNATRVFPAMEAAVAKLPPELANAARSITSFSDLSVDELDEASDQALQTALELERLNDPTFDPIISQLLLFAQRAQEYLGTVRSEASTTANALARLGGVSVGGEASEAIVAAQGAGMVGGLGGPAGPMGGRFGGVPLPDDADIVNPLAPSRGGGGGGGGAGAAANPIVAQIEQLQNALMTQEEMQIASFERQQETLNAALEQRLLTQQEYNALMEQSQSQHAEKMTQIDVYRYGTTLQKTGKFMGDMAAALQSGNEKMLKIVKVFSAAEALINVMEGASKEIAKGGLAGIARAAMVVAAGMQFVNAIKGVSAGGGGAAPAGVAGGVAAAGAAPAAPAVSRNVAISLQGGDMFSRDQVINLINNINEAVEDGAIVRLV